MAIPDFQSLMLPIMQYASDGQEHHVRDLIYRLSDDFQLTEAERKVMLPSGRAKLFDNRFGWACTHLRKSGLLVSPKRAYVKITDRGLSVLAQKPKEIKMKHLRQYPEYLSFISAKQDGESEVAQLANANEETPQESIELGYANIRKNLETELLGIVKASSPEFFEQLVVDLLVSMGYGGSLYDAGKAIGKSGDGGIDGIIKEDKLGLDVVYIQAKRWDNGTVSRPEVQKFAGALQGQRARKGVFITTSTFTKEALEFARQIDSKIVLIDGQQLAELMIDNDVGVSTVATYQIKKVDSDYFFEE